ncbi:uncharacterized protein LOC121771313 isoform X2 [Salvia splendens]|uniref:uncharacterized protein LOC121771313 isoform X2 n=1 Tax=Salvia splendens TaxID=180675 RepID=UPI001C275A1E|nr:uncharacterized protein LOC121771313 isoform X2 [Salvia splendens]
MKSTTTFSVLLKTLNHLLLLSFDYLSTMDLIFVLLTQLINTTPFELEFEDADGNRSLLPSLRPGKTGFAKQIRILRHLNRSGRAWKFRVLVDGKFTGIEMDPQVVMDCVRVVFCVEGGVLCVKRVHEKRVDAFFRLRGEFESMCLSHTQMPTNLKRNEECQCQHLPPYVGLKNRGEEDGSKCSTRRAEEDGNECSTSEEEAEANVRSSASDSPAGANNINVGDNLKERTKNLNPHLDPPIKSRGRIGNTPRPRPRPPNDNVAPAQRGRPIDYEPSSNHVVEKDSFVHGMLLVFAFIVFIWLRFF